MLVKHPGGMSCCRWTLSSERPPTWTTWLSCMKDGPPGCEGCADLCRWSNQGLEIHQSPVGQGSWSSSTGPPGGKNAGVGTYPPPLLNSWAHWAARCNPIPQHRPWVDDSASGPADPPSFMGSGGQIGAGTDEGKEKKGLLILLLDIAPPNPHIYKHLCVLLSPTCPCGGSVEQTWSHH